MSKDILIVDDNPDIRNILKKSNATILVDDLSKVNINHVVKCA